MARSAGSCYRSCRSATAASRRDPLTLTVRRAASAALGRRWSWPTCTWSKGGAFAARQPVPPYDSHATLERLEGLIARHRPGTVVSSSTPSTIDAPGGERSADLHRLCALTGRAAESGSPVTTTPRCPGARRCRRGRARRRRPRPAPRPAARRWRSWPSPPNAVGHSLDCPAAASPPTPTGRCCRPSELPPAPSRARSRDRPAFPKAFTPICRRGAGICFPHHVLAAEPMPGAIGYRR